MLILVRCSAPHLTMLESRPPYITIHLMHHYCSLVQSRLCNYDVAIVQFTCHEIGVKNVRVIKLLMMSVHKHR